MQAFLIVRTVSPFQQFYVVFRGQFGYIKTRILARLDADLGMFRCQFGYVETRIGVSLDADRGTFKCQFGYV